VLAATFSIGMAPANASTNRLPNGEKLTAGHCLRHPGSSSSGDEAKFCVGQYYNFNLWYGGKICWGYQAPGHLKGPEAFIRVAKNGDIEFYQYPGGPRLWHSGTGVWNGADLVVSSNGVAAYLVLDKIGVFHITYKWCNDKFVGP
jgi:hypothetical protein